MFTTTIIIALGVAVLSILFGLGLYRNVKKQSEGNKRIIDNVKIILIEVKKNIGKQNSALFAMSALVFVIILYLLNWQTAIGFLTGVLATIVTNLFLVNIVAKNSGRVVEVSRKGMPTGANLALKSGTIAALFSSGISLLMVAGFYAIFKDMGSLIGLSFGVCLVTLFIKLSRNDNEGLSASPSLGFFESTIIAMITAMILGKLMIHNGDNAVLFPIILASASTIAFTISSIFMRFYKKTKSIAIVLYRGLGILAVLFAVATYFSYNWIMKGIGLAAMVNFYGLAIVALIVLFLGGMAILLNVYNQITKNATLIAEKSEMPEDATGHLAAMGASNKIFGKITNLYSIKCTALISIAIFAAYYKSILKLDKTFSLDLGNYFVLIGLFIGVLAVSLYYFQKNKFSAESINKTVLLCSVAVLLPVIIGLTLGPVSLGGYVIGIIVTGLFAMVLSLMGTQSISNGDTSLREMSPTIIKISAIVALLIASYIV